MYKGRMMNIIGYAKESPRLTANVTPTKWFPSRSFSAGIDNSFREDNSALGIREAVTGKEITKQQVKAELEITNDVDNVGEWLFLGYGQVVTAQDATSGAYTHTFSKMINSVLPPSVTLHRLAGDNGWKYFKGCLVDKIEFSFTTEDSTVKISFIGQSEEDGTTKTYTAVKPSKSILGRHVKAKWATTVAGLSTGTSFSITDLTISMDFGGKSIEELGSITPTEMAANGTKMEAKFTGYVKNSDFYSYYKTGNKLAFQFEAEATNLPRLGTSSTLYPKETFIIAPSTPEITYSAPNDEFMKFDCTVAAEYSPTDGFAMKTILQNTIANY